MSRLVVFAFGALFGAACVLYFFVLNRPEPALVELATCPPAVAAVAPLELCVTPPVSLQPEAADARLAIPILPNSEPGAAAPPAPPAPVTADSALRPQPAPLLIPVAGVEARQLSDTFTDSRGGGRVHDAIDIMAPRGTPVVAVDSGRVVKLFKSVPGGLTIYQFDPGEQFAYYYAHLDAYAPGIVEGKPLQRGDLLGYVGYSGNASAGAPHLHFAIFVLGADKRWWEGTAVNPYPFFTDP